MTHPDRRTVLGAASLMAAGLAAGSAPAQPATPAAAFTPRPLAFDPTKIPGLSEKLLRSHYDNNYVGAVKRLGAIRGELGKFDIGAAPNFVLNGLKREELMAWNSMVLHEVHFDGFGEQVAPAPKLAEAIERDFGSHDRWASEFASFGKALGGGSGWVLLTWSHRDQRLMNQWASDHTQALAGGEPLLALDMYEHAYHMDYGAKAGAYVDAFMKVVSWNGANARFGAAMWREQA
jgi:superoxide dismutase, Fe-Mn family